MADTLPNRDNRAVLLERCRMLIEARQPVTVIEERILGKDYHGYEALWLPLSEDGKTISMLMCALFYRDGAVTSLSTWRPESAA
jgi:hypothetical protein